VVKAEKKNCLIAKLNLPRITKLCLQCRNNIADKLKQGTKKIAKNDNLVSGVGAAGDAAASPINFFRQIWQN